MTDQSLDGDPADLVLAVYLDDLVSDRQVLFVGDPDPSTLERLAARARTVDVVVPGGRARGTRRGGNVRSRSWPRDDDAGRWHVVVVPDLDAAAITDADAVEEAGRWVHRDGVVVLAFTPPADDPVGAYEAFFDLATPAFAEVRMLGEAPFLGRSVVDLDPSTRGSGVTFDGSLVGPSAPTRFYAVCSQRPLHVDGHAVIQLPSVEAPPVADDELDHGELAALGARLREQEDQLEQAGVHAEELEAALATARRQVDEVRAEAREAEARAERIRSELQTIETEPPAAPDAEYERLEATLADRAGELTGLRSELERRATLVRDLVEELREARGSAASTTGGEDPRLHQAIQRAVASEAERVELRFRLDEVRGELAILEGRTGAVREQDQRDAAAYEGRVRGLAARLAEADERLELTQARLTLAEDDRKSLELRNTELLRELSETRDQLALEMARVRAVEADRAAGDASAKNGAGAIAGDAAAEREGQLLGALVRAREEAADARENAEVGARASRSLEEVEQFLEGIRLGYEMRVAELQNERDRLAAQVDGQRTESANEQGDHDELRGEVAGLRLRLADREAAVLALRDAAMPSGSAEPATSPSEEPAPRPSLVPVMDAMLVRLQQSLTDARARRGASDGAVLDGRGELPLGEPPGGEVGTALRETRSLLASLAAEVSSQRPAEGADPAEVRQLRRRVAELDSLGADRELILRSMTAQLQERDDRIRALERLQDGDGVPPGAEDELRRRLLEMEERATRLASELASEREARRRAETPHEP